MPYSATAYRLLISVPGDVPDPDLETVVRAVGRWNAIYGRSFGAVVVPLHWRDHTAAQHGIRPQASINKQLVNTADIVIALFWHRIGSDTGEVESGTVEEIDEASDAGAYVGILHCTRDYPTDVDTEQLGKLRDFFERIRGDSLILDYADGAELASHVDMIINTAVSREGAQAEAAADQAPPVRAAEVWPRVETGERTSSSGKPRRYWQLVLTNTGSEPARNVRYRFEAENPGEDVPDQVNPGDAVESLAPGGEVPYNLLVHMGIAAQFRCVVTWSDSTGEDHENIATLRLF